MQFVPGGIVAVVLTLSVALPAQAQGSKAKPAGAHVAISLGDGTTIESKGKGSPGSVKRSNNSAGATTNYNPKELKVDQHVPWTQKN